MKWNLKIVVSVLLLILGVSQTKADIYEWRSAVAASCNRPPFAPAVAVFLQCQVPT